MSPKNKHARLLPQLSGSYVLSNSIVVRAEYLIWANEMTSFGTCDRFWFCNHDLSNTTCVFPWILNWLKQILNASIWIRMKILEIYWYWNSFCFIQTHFIFPLEMRKSFKMALLPLGDTWFNSKTLIVISYSRLKSHARNAHICRQ